MTGPAWIAAAILAAVAVLQLTLATGAPIGGVAWGGRWPGRLPWYLRAGSAVSVIVLLVFAYLILARAGLAAGATTSKVPTIAVAGFLALSTLLSFWSKSWVERWVLAPLAAVAAVCALMVAIWA